MVSKQAIDDIRIQVVIFADSIYSLVKHETLHGERSSPTTRHKNIEDLEHSEVK